MLKLLAALAGLGLCLAGCVAPEEPESHRAATPAAAPQTRSSSPQANFEDAPVPNRRVRRGTDDEIIRLAK